LLNYSSTFAILASVAMIVATVAGFDSRLIISKTTTSTTTAYALSDKEHPTNQDKYCFTAAKKDDRANPETLNCSPTNEDCEDARDAILDIESLEVFHCTGYSNSNNNQ
jgi:hypothetical protein